MSHNPAIGRFLSVDPLTRSYPWYTPYQFAGNKPIAFIDLEGLEEFDATFMLNNEGYLYLSKWDETDCSASYKVNVFLAHKGSTHSIGSLTEEGDFDILSDYMMRNGHKRSPAFRNALQEIRRGNKHPNSAFNLKFEGSSEMASGAFELSASDMVFSSKAEILLDADFMTGGKNVLPKIGFTFMSDNQIGMKGNLPLFTTDAIQGEYEIYKSDGDIIVETKLIGVLGGGKAGLGFEQIEYLNLTTGGRGYDMFGTARLRVFEMQFNIDALKETNQNHEQSFENVTKWRDDFLEYRRKINNSDNGNN